MSDVSYHNSPFAPEQYADFEGLSIKRAFEGKAGVLAYLCPEEEHFSWSDVFFSPVEHPDKFYSMDLFFSSSHNTEFCHGFITGTSPSRIYIYTEETPSEPALLVYSDTDICNRFPSNELKGDRRFFSALNKENVDEIDHKMKSGEAQFFSLPQDSFVYSLYSVPDDGTSSLAGTIAICRKSFYHHQYQALYVPRGKSGPAQSIAFYDKEKRLAPADLDYLPLTRRGVLDVTLDDGDKFAVDFSRAVYHWGDEKKALAKTLLLPCVPDTPTPLVTPLTAKDIFEGGLSVSPR